MKLNSAEFPFKMGTFNRFAFSSLDVNELEMSWEITKVSNLRDFFLTIYIVNMCTVSSLSFFGLSLMMEMSQCIMYIGINSLWEVLSGGCIMSEIKTFLLLLLCFPVNYKTDSSESLI